MKQALAIFCSLAAVFVLCSEAAIAQYLPGQIVSIDVRELSAHPWKTLGTRGASSYSYQFSHAINYSGSATSQNVNADVLLRESIRGANGKVAQVNLSYIEVICNPDQSFSNHFVLHGATTYDTDDDGDPGAPADNIFRFDSTAGQIVTTQQGSVGARLQKAVCGDKSLFANVSPLSKRPFTATLDGSLIDTNAMVVEGHTNLPDGTALYIEFHRGTYSASTSAKAQGGFYRSQELKRTTEIGPSSFHGDYDLVVRSAPATYQSAAVVSVIGNNGSNLRGDQVHDGEVRFEMPIAVP